jgi:hypothetical protein
MVWKCYRYQWSVRVCPEVEFLDALSDNSKL